MSTQQNSETPRRRWKPKGIFSKFNLKRLHSSSPPPRSKQSVLEIALPEVSPTPPTTPFVEEGGTDHMPVGFSPGPFDPYVDFDAIHDMENGDIIGSDRGTCNFFRGFLTCFLPEANTTSMRGRDTEGLTPVPRRLWRSSRGLGAVGQGVI